MVMPAPLPEALCIGQRRLTAGLDRQARIDRRAYQQVFGRLPRRSAEQLIAMAAQVDLRGRGGAGFPFSRKLSAVRAAARSRKRTPVIAVNGMEGEPGSVKDRMLLLRSPHLVLSGAHAAAIALRAEKIVVGVTDSLVARSVRQAAGADPELRGMVEVVRVPGRFVSGESGALINAINGKAPLPPGRKSHASSAGVGNRPTLLSNAETFAQLAVLTMLGSEGYASTGTSPEPGTVLLTVGGSVGRPAVVEVPTGIYLGDVLDMCGAAPAEGVLVGGYHGSWLSAGDAYVTPVSRAGLSAAGGTLGAGIVLVLGEDSCPIGEVARVGAYLARESSGQCGPCKLGLPGVARSLAAITAGSGGVEELDTLRRGAASVRGRGACAHPDGVARFVLSALDVFADDLAEHFFRGGCGRRTGGDLPVPAAEGNLELTVDWTRCEGHGLCAHIVPELVQLDEQGFPVPLDMPVPAWLEREARQAVEMCPALALRLTPAEPAAAEMPPPKRSAGPGRVVTRPVPGRVVAGHDAVRRRSIPPPVVNARRPALLPAPQPVEDDRVRTGKVVDLAVSEDWIAGLAASQDRN